MHEVVAEVLEAVPRLSLERLLGWARGHRGTLLLATLLLAAAVLLAQPATQKPEVDVAPDETPLFV